MKSYSYFSLAVVSATLLMPVGAQADITVYGRVNNAIVFDKPGGNLVAKKSTTDIRSVGSRFGLKGNSDLGNGLTAHGHIEFAITTDREKDGVVDTRIGSAGISGGFGRIDVGNLWSAFYNSVGVDIDPTYTIGPIGGTPYRSSNTIKYSNSVGPLALAIDIRQNDAKDTGANAEGGNGVPGTTGIRIPLEANALGLRGNGVGLGLRLAATDNITLALAYDTEDHSKEMKTDAGMDKKPYQVGTKHKRLGVTGKATFGNFWGSVGYSKHEANAIDTNNSNGDAGTDNDRTNGEYQYVTLYVGANFTDKTSAMIGWSQKQTKSSIIFVGDKDADTLAAARKVSEMKKPTRIVLGIYHNFGGGLRLWYEGKTQDNDDNNADPSKHMVGIRYDF